jgi:hypothetical protein
MKVIVQTGYLSFIGAVLPIGRGSHLPGLNLDGRVAQPKQGLQLEGVELEGLLEEVDRLRVFLSEVVIQACNKGRFLE